MSIDFNGRQDEFCVFYYYIQHFLIYKLFYYLSSFLSRKPQDFIFRSSPNCFVWHVSSISFSHLFPRKTSHPSYSLPPLHFHLFLKCFVHYHWQIIFPLSHHFRHLKFLQQGVHLRHQLRKLIHSLTAPTFSVPPLRWPYLYL